MANGNRSQRRIQQVALEDLGGEDRLVAPEEFQEIMGDRLRFAGRMNRRRKDKPDPCCEKLQQRYTAGP